MLNSRQTIKHIPAITDVDNFPYKLYRHNNQMVYEISKRYKHLAEKQVSNMDDQCKVTLDDRYKDFIYIKVTSH